MKRITGRTLGGIVYVRSETGNEGVGAYTTERRLPEVISRLAAIEDILGDDYDLERVRELVSADVVPVARRRMFVNNPFPALFEAFECLYKYAESVEVYLVMPEEFDLTGDDGETAVGLTLCPDDGGEPVIYVSAELPFYNVVEIVAHEMAHVIAGQDAGHSDEWEQAFSDIHMLYGAIYDKNMKDRLIDLED